ncbi:DUF551 domain-containing protein [Raoultella planticola]|uniref:DUF551 domain-containing protein n=1 Tax=Raoultella planticola TaxID=575 RepID=UPI00388EA417
MKDHQIRELVNQLRDIAIKYHAAGQLREQISRVVRAACQAQLVCTCPSGDGSLRWPCPAHSGLRPAQDGNYPAIPDGYRLQPISEYEAMCATVNSDEWPQRWIPVSERMPDVGVKVLCFPVKDEPIHATFNGQLWLQDVSWSGSDDPIDNVIPVSVTHWMPLPAAPQEVNHG